MYSNDVGEDIHNEYGPVTLNFWAKNTFQIYESVCNESSSTSSVYNNKTESGIYYVKQDLNAKIYITNDRYKLSPNGKVLKGEIEVKIITYKLKVPVIVSKKEYIGTNALEQLAVLNFSDINSYKLGEIEIERVETLETYNTQQSTWIRSGEWNDIELINQKVERTILNSSSDEYKGLIKTPEF